ncbi:MAG: ABC transporter permease subunit [Kibdelosporangium sp.]
MSTISRSGIGLPDIAWVTWRQHRTVIGVTALLAIATAAITAWMTAQVRADWTNSGDDFPYHMIGDVLSLQFLHYPSVLGALIAVFWAAPLLTREYEQRTQVVAWGQDISPRRWLAGKVVVLAGIATALTAGLTIFTANMVGMIRELGTLNLQPFDVAAFEANVLLQACYTVFGFALGVAFSALGRNTIFAMAGTLIVFAGFRLFVGTFVREHYLPSLHGFRPWDPPGVRYQPLIPVDGHRIDSGYADAAGNPFDKPIPECYGDEACLRANGVAGHYATWQPVDRVPGFQLIESGLFILLAAGLIAVAFSLVKRRNKI